MKRIVTAVEDGSQLVLRLDGDQLVFQHEARGDPETLAAASFYVRWFKVDSRKHIVCFGDDAGHPDVDHIAINTPYQAGAPAMFLPGGPTFKGRRLCIPASQPFISGIVSAEWLVPGQGGHQAVHVVVTPPLEWPQRYPEDFPESLRM